MFVKGDIRPCTAEQIGVQTHFAVQFCQSLALKQQLSRTCRRPLASPTTGMYTLANNMKHVVHADSANVSAEALHTFITPPGDMNGLK